MAVKPYSWLSRQAESRLVNSEQLGADAIDKISTLYQSAQAGLNQRIADIYRNYSNATGVDIAQLMERMNVGEQASFLTTIRKALGSMGINFGDVYNSSYVARLNRLDALKQQIYWQTLQIAPQEIDISRGTYGQILKTSSTQLYKDLGQFNGFNANFQTLDTNMIEAVLASKWAGRDFATSVWGNTAGRLADRLPEVLGSALISGQPYGKTVTLLRQEFGASRSDVERLVRTETNYFNNQAELASYSQDNIQYYKLLVTLDGRTSEICLDLSIDDKTYRVDEAAVGVNYPPFHPHCRTTTVPIFADTQKQASRVNIQSNDIRQPSTIQDLQETWGNAQFADTGVAGFGMDSIITKLKQGGDHALNAESEWISKTLPGMNPLKQQQAMQRLDQIVAQMKDAGQKSQVEMVKKFLEMDLKGAGISNQAQKVTQMVDVGNGTFTVTAQQTSKQASDGFDEHGNPLSANALRKQAKEDLKISEDLNPFTGKKQKPVPVEDFTQFHQDMTIQPTRDQQRALADYVDMGFAKTNPMLRNQLPIDAKGIRLTSELTDLLDLGQAPYDMKVYRAARTRLLGGLKEGDVFMDQAFTSTSLDKTYIDTLFKDPQNDSLIEINIPKGAPIVDVTAALQGTNFKYNEAEQEVLMPIGSAFKVNKIVENSDGSKKYIFDMLDFNQLPTLK